MKVGDVTSAKRNLTSSFEDLKTPVTEEKKQEPELLDEPILTENKNRFVLFPIKYHEVSLPTS